MTTPFPPAPWRVMYPATPPRTEVWLHPCGAWVEVRVSGMDMDDLRRIVDDLPGAPEPGQLIPTITCRAVNWSKP